jgi:hypothetical protein
MGVIASQSPSAKHSFDLGGGSTDGAIEIGVAAGSEAGCGAL